MLGVRLNLGRGGVMGGSNDAKFDNKRSLDNLAVGDKKGKEAEGRESRGGGGCTLKAGAGTGGKGTETTVFPWMPISTRGTFYDEYTSSYVLC